MTTFLQQIVNGLSLGSIYALIALGYTMVYGVLRLINFAHGDVYMLGAYAGYYISIAMGGDQPSLGKAFLVMLGSMVACAIVGVIIERSVYRPLRSAARLTLGVTALFTSLLIENTAPPRGVFGASPQKFPPLAPSVSFLVGGMRFTSEQLLVIGVSVVLMLFLRWFVLKTKTGKAMRAVS